MGAQLKLDTQLTIEEFLEFCEGRPNGERWELIEGVAVLNASPTDFHQVIVGNVLRYLLNWQDAHNAPWVAMIGIGTKVPASKNSLPQPDLLVKENALTGTALTDDALLLIEVLSKSNTKADQAWRKQVYSSVPNCQQYVTVQQSRCSVTRYDRANNWRGAELKQLDDRLDLPALGANVSVSLTEIYRWTPVGGKI
jgi:Uma2 family endonuclease